MYTRRIDEEKGLRTSTADRLVIECCDNESKEKVAVTNETMTEVIGLSEKSKT